MTEDEMVGWHHQLNGNESEQTPRDRSPRDSFRTEEPGVLQSMRLRQLEHDLATEYQQWEHLTSKR